MFAPLRIFWLLALLLVGPAWADAPAPAPALGQFKPVPALTARVTDQVGMLTAEQRQRLESVLADYETKTGSQIGVLLVASTEPEAIEQYSIRVADAWKLGRKGVDDGVLLLVARDNPKALRRLRIEAGRGVQGVLTDAQSKRILQDTIAPYFRDNHYYEGLVAGVGAIATLLNAEKFPAPPSAQAPQGHAVAAGGGSGAMSGLFVAFAAIVILRMFFRSSRSRLVQPGLRGGHGGWGGATTGFVIGNILANAAEAERHRGGGFSGSGGFSDSGGGFSGGGGSFDGGGASGDW